MHGEVINVAVAQELLSYVSTWFHELEEMSSTISLTVNGTIINLDRMFVGAMFVTEITEDDVKSKDDEEEEDEV
jgi:hypothetical protein